MGLNLEILKAITSYAWKNQILDKTMILIANSHVVIIPLYLIYLWFKGRDEKEVALLAATGIIVSLIISTGISSVYYHPRPFAIGAANPLFGHEADSSFPSDATTAMFSLAFMILLVRWYRSGSILVVLASLLGLARIFCGVHWPLDILGGIVVGFIGSYITFVFRNKLDKFYNNLIDKYSRVIHKSGR